MVVIIRGVFSVGKQTGLKLKTSRLRDLVFAFTVICRKKFFFFFLRKSVPIIFQPGHLAFVLLLFFNCCMQRDEAMTADYCIIKVIPRLINNNIPVI